LEPVRESIQIDHESKLYQNGKPISVVDLDKLLSQIGQMTNPPIQVHLETEMGARCATVEQVRNLFEKHLDCSEYGQCAEGIKVWRERPRPPGATVS
jgi:hypothetical protein